MVPSQHSLPADGNSSFLQKFNECSEGIWTWLGDGVYFNRETKSWALMGWPKLSFKWAKLKIGLLGYAFAASNLCLVHFL